MVAPHERNARRVLLINVTGTSSSIRLSVCCSRTSGDGPHDQPSRHVVPIVAEGVAKPQDEPGPGTRTLRKDSGNTSLLCYVGFFRLTSPLVNPMVVPIMDRFIVISK